MVVFLWFSGDFHDFLLIFHGFLRWFAGLFLRVGFGGVCFWRRVFTRFLGGDGVQENNKVYTSARCFFSWLDGLMFDGLFYGGFIVDLW